MKNSKGSTRENSDLKSFQEIQDIQLTMSSISSATLKHRNSSGWAKILYVTLNRIVAEITIPVEGYFMTMSGRRENQNKFFKLLRRMQRTLILLVGQIRIERKIERYDMAVA